MQECMHALRHAAHLRASSRNAASVASAARRASMAIALAPSWNCRARRSNWACREVKQPWARVRVYATLACPDAHASWQGGRPQLARWRIKQSLHARIYAQTRTLADARSAAARAASSCSIAICPRSSAFARSASASCWLAWLSLASCARSSWPRPMICSASFECTKVEHQGQSLSRCVELASPQAKESGSLARVHGQYRPRAATHLCAKLLRRGLCCGPS